MSVKRRDLVKYFEGNGFYLLRQRRRHSIYTNKVKTIPIKRDRTIDRITANELLNANDQLRREDVSRVLVINEATGKQTELIIDLD